MLERGHLYITTSSRTQLMMIVWYLTMKFWSVSKPRGRKHKASYHLDTARHYIASKRALLLSEDKAVILVAINTLRPRQNGRHFADDTFKRIFMNENVKISINISLKFVPKCLINNIPALVQIMAWRRPGDKALSEPMMVRLPTHICVTRPQRVNIKQGKSEGFDSCDRPSNLTQIGLNSSIFQPVWP